MFESLSTLLTFFTSGASVMSTFELPGGELSELAKEHPLDQPTKGEEMVMSRHERAEWLDAAQVGVGELCSGTGAYGDACAERLLWLRRALRGGARISAQHSTQ